MDNKFGVEHEKEVLAAFDKMTDDFGRGLPMHQEGDIKVTLDDLFDEEGISKPAEPVRASRSERNAAKKKTSKGGILQGLKKKAETLAEKASESSDEVSEAPKPKKTKKKKSGKKNYKLRRIILTVLCVCIALGIIGGVVVGAYVLRIIKDSPEINPSNIYSYLNENSVMLDNEGNFVENVYNGDALRSNVDYGDLPENLVNAFVAIEDKTFWKHHGFNYIRIIGAVVDSVKTGKRVGGTSTLTQQLARNIYLSEVKSERSIERKIREAYYTYILEKSLTKEQILEAYLNTINLGFNSNGVIAASTAYFNKDVQDLDIVECAILASLPQSPSNYAPIKRISADNIEDESQYDIVSKNGKWVIIYNNTVETRVKLVLRFMHEQEYITDEEYEEAKATEVRSVINPGMTILSASGASSYFSDYVVETVLEDIQSELGYDADEARKLLYSGGLTINTTLNSKIQSILEEEYDNTDNFPSVGTYDSDKNGNILDANGKILLYKMSNIIQPESGYFILSPEEFSWLSNGDLIIYKGNRLNIYKTSVGDNIDYSVEFKNMFEKEDGFFYSRSGGVWSIASKYKDRDADGNLILSSQYFTDYPDAFTKNNDDSLSLAPKYFTIADRVRQPQSAMVIEEFATGAIVGMIGGRDIEGKKLFNRATSPRQPGSSMKPLAVYSTALQYGVDGKGNYTAATPLDDAPMSFSGNPWPKNWYTGYRGITNLRNAVEQSINACAVNLYMQLDPYDCIENLQNMGISTVVTSGNVNDVNASALALGGMTKGVSPLEMCAAYGTFGNYGVFNEAVCYTTVTNKKGDVILEKVGRSTQVYDESVASLMTDILRTVVTQGLASGAKLNSQASAGKTGTTSDRYDIWFCGLTPKYSAATWIGNDINISLNKGSDAAVKVWKAVMERVGELDPRAEFEKKGDFVSLTVDRYSGKLLSDLSAADSRGNSELSEIFIRGTEPTELDDAHVIVNVCPDTGYLATPSCPGSVSKIGIVRPGGLSWEKMVVDYNFTRLTLESEPDSMYDAPDYYCPLHNPDPEAYPVSPLYNGTALYNPSDVTYVPETGHWEENPETGELVWISDYAEYDIPNDLEPVEPEEDPNW